MTHEIDGIAEAFALLNPEPTAATVTTETEGAEAQLPAEVSAELDALKAEREQAQAEMAQLREQGYRRDLDGKVSDVTLAMRVLDPAKHIDAQGRVNIHELTVSD